MMKKVTFIALVVCLMATANYGASTECFENQHSKPDCENV